MEHDISLEVGDFVKWNGEKWHGKPDNKRVDVITKIGRSTFGDVAIYTREVNAPSGEVAKIGKGYAGYFTKVASK